MSAEIFGWLRDTTLATSLAALLVLCLRAMFRRAFGARMAHALWLLPPLAVLTVMLPARTTPPPVAMAQAVAVSADAAAQSSAPAMADFDAKPWLAMAWGIGAIACCAASWRRQRRFVHALGELVPHADGTWRTRNSRIGPVAVGVLKSRIVLPLDFEQRHDETARSLILQHERTHIARRDPFANAIAAAMRCVWWFNPLLHLAARGFRFDQELAVDATVLAHRPRMQQAYARALFDAQMQFQSPALACQWSAAHPLKLRISLLEAAAPATARRLAGMFSVALLAGGVSLAAWAAQPATVTAGPQEGDAPDITITLTRGDGSIQRARFPGVVSGQWYSIPGKPGDVEFSIETFGAGPVSIEGHETVLDTASVAIRTRIATPEKSMSTPSILLRRGSTGMIRLGANPAVGPPPPDGASALPPDAWEWTFEISP